MSSVTNIIITGSCNEEYESKFAEAFNPFGRFSEVGNIRTRGWRVECSVFIGAFNYMDHQLFCSCLTRFKSLISQYDWNTTQVLIKGEHDQVWNVHRAEDITPESFE